jgi:hypothetical protein
MLDLGRIDVEEIATALADQTDYEHRWLIDPRTGEVVFWTSDTGIDGENPVDIDELDLIVIDPSVLRVAQGHGRLCCRHQRHHGWPTVGPVSARTGSLPTIQEPAL